MQARFLLLGVLAIAGLPNNLLTDVRAQVLVMPVNSAAEFSLRVDVDKPDRIYRQGDQMTVRVSSEKDCYLYLFHFDARGRAQRLFPNRASPNNFVTSNTKVLVPDSNGPFAIEIGPPFGRESLVAVATLKPLNIPIALDARGVAARLRQWPRNQWAEGRIHITTRPRRIAVCIGISKYKHNDVTPLQVCHRDAERFAKALEEECDVDEVILLTDAHATRAAIEHAIFRQLPSKVEPGDTVFIFYSGHGWRMQDQNGDEPDGLDEVLLPHDGRFDDPSTMIVDDTFARWLRELDGCHICIILDNCYSGGSSKGLFSKGLGKPEPQQIELDFFDGEINRAKAMGQTGTMLLAACQPSQLAWEMPSGQGGVLSHHLLQLIGPVTAAEKLQQARAIKQADANADEKISLRELFEYVREPIQDYVKRTFNEDQTPVLINNDNDRIVIKP